MKVLELSLDRSVLDPGETRTDAAIIFEWIKWGFVKKLNEGGSLADHLLWWEIETVFSDALNEEKGVTTVTITDSQFRYIQHLLENLNVPGSATRFFRMLITKLNLL